MTRQTGQRIAVVWLAGALLGPASVAFCAGEASKTRPAQADHYADRAVPKSGRTDVEGRPVPDRNGEPAAGGGWVQTLVALGIVAALIFAVRYVLRRYAGRTGGKATSNALEVLTRTPVSPRQQLLLVRLGRRLVLVGCGPEGMTPLTEVTDREEVASLLATASGSLVSVEHAPKNAEAPDESGSEVRE